MSSGNNDDTLKPLHLFNTMGRKLEPFEPRGGNKVKIFTCGPSIYGRPHIGNYRTYLYEDILERYLRYLDYKVDRLINYTDVEDKSIARIQEQGKTLTEVTEPNAAIFRKEAANLQIKLPEYIPRSSTSVDQAVKLITILLEKGYAYRHGRDIFFDPLKFKGFGRLYGLDMSKWPKKRRRYAKDTYPGRRWNLGDFILWHGCRPEWGEGVCWESELGKGRPAWNVQDPAMITAHLGDQIDISCGGIDNLWRHHDYNLAIIEASSGKEFAHYWLHGEHVLLNGRKMSKSKGNIVYPGDIIDKGYSHNHIRFHLLRTHYRKKINLTDKSLAKSRELLDTLQLRIRNILDPELHIKNDADRFRTLLNALQNDFRQAMNHDLDTDGAIKTLTGNLDRLERFKEQQGLNKHQTAEVRHALTAMDSVLQIFSF